MLTPARLRGYGYLTIYFEEIDYESAETNYGFERGGLPDGGIGL
jgi:hypothetical protein